MEKIPLEVKLAALEAAAKIVAGKANHESFDTLRRATTESAERFEQHLMQERYKRS